ncbi:hypothetical protein HanHA300_Chr09g0306281 [Helianthus annuus]|nr:hypothetical protein HanHA300_Chr09g0306281 [Helianthus annuus]KAJ0541308.1 hypothetical protein HanHA89_Chr09g0326951 [Helianthus annuus]KAJ0706387.1 hypothetical protein HanLR1_Chr09g0306421 [Helianthus annuus]
MRRAYGAATLFVAGNRRIFSYRQSLQLHFLLFSIADLGSRRRTRCDSSPLCRTRSSHPGGDTVFLHWRPPNICYTFVGHISFYPQIFRSVFLESQSRSSNGEIPQICVSFHKTSRSVVFS